MNPHKKLTVPELQKRFAESQIYPVVTPSLCAGRDPVFVLSELLKGGAKIVQLRAKDLSNDELFVLATKFREITTAYDALLIINDSVPLALRCHADGVHLGQTDMPLREAKITAPGLLIGVSTHNKTEIEEALADGAGYINIGPIFPTQTKNTGVDPLGVATLTNLAKLVNIPFSVMGGIKEHHIPELYSAGARVFAMVTELTQANQIDEKMNSLLRQVENAR